MDQWFLFSRVVAGESLLGDKEIHHPCKTVIAAEALTSQMDNCLTITFGIATEGRWLKISLLYDGTDG